jgi:hypothetical protein
MKRKINIEEKLDKFISKKTLAGVEDVVILQNSEGSYELFNQYNICKTANDEYTVTIHGKHFLHRFYTLRNAVIWCTCDKRNKIVESARIIDLDAKLTGIDANIEVQRRLFKKTQDPDIKLIHVAKLNSDKAKRFNIIHELSSYIEESKTWQLKKFNTKPEH